MLWWKGFSTDCSSIVEALAVGQGNIACRQVEEPRLLLGPAQVRASIEKRCQMVVECGPNQTAMRRMGSLFREAPG